MPISSHFQQLRNKIGCDLLQIPGVAAVIHDRTGRILLQQNTGNNTWSLPAGSIEPGETPAQAVVREVWEETSLKVRPIKILGVFGGENFRYTYTNGDLVEYLVVLFRCEPIDISDRLSGRDGETADLQYFHPADLPALPIEYPIDLLVDRELSQTHFDWNEVYLQHLL
jgi:8-oxo-dGTP pyrophosphatase MutT (NUDIX family)